MDEIHINTRGCKKPIDRRTIVSLAELLKAAYRIKRRRLEKTNRFNWQQKHEAKKKWKTREIRLHPHCWYCNAQLTMKTATIDHIVPLVDGGSDGRKNWALACSECNARKGKNWLVEKGLKLKFKRRK